MPRLTTRLHIEYRRSDDILFATTSPGKAAESDVAAPDFYVHFDPDTGSPIGFECLDFSEHVQDPEWLRSLPDLGVFSPEGSHERMTLAETLVYLWRHIREVAEGDRIETPFDAELATT